jgi:ArsR family transcriptional regulator, arsenate/arsenite/antimonite-responsive transcriptional repressor
VRQRFAQRATGALRQSFESRAAPQSQGERLIGALYFDIIRNMEIIAAVTALEALAQESRVGIFRLLVAAGKSGLPAGQIAGRMRLPNATMSFHLSQLKHAGLITCRRVGRSLIYSADFSVMGELIGFLTEDCCQGKVGSCIPASTLRLLKRKASP